MKVIGGRRFIGNEFTRNVRNTKCEYYYRISGIWKIYHQIVNMCLLFLIILWKKANNKCKNHTKNGSEQNSDILKISLDFFGNTDVRSILGL